MQPRKKGLRSAAIDLFKPRTTDTQWRQKSKKPENSGRCGRQNMLPPYLKIWEWEWIFGRAVKAIFSLGVRSPWFKLLASSRSYHGLGFKHLFCVSAFTWEEKISIIKIACFMRFFLIYWNAFILYCYLPYRKLLLVDKFQSKLRWNKKKTLLSSFFHMIMYDPHFMYYYCSWICVKWYHWLNKETI